jgi:aconitate hydratase
MFKSVYGSILNGSKMWQDLEATKGSLYTWDEKSTYIHNPPFFSKLQHSLPEIKSIKNANCLLNLGDSITTDHISPAGNIAK